MKKRSVTRRKFDMSYHDGVDFDVLYLRGDTFEEFKKEIEKLLDGYCDEIRTLRDALHKSFHERRWVR